MSRTTATVLLWLFVINLGVAFGAGVYEQAIVVPRWINDAPDSGAHWNAEAAREDDTGRRFWGFVSTVPLTLLTLGNLYAASRASGALRIWWRTAALAALAERAVTFFYFIPAMVRLMESADSPQSVAAALQWSQLNYIRLAIVLAAWLASLRAFAAFYETGRDFRH